MEAIFLRDYLVHGIFGNGEMGLSVGKHVFSGANCRRENQGEVSFCGCTVS